MSKAHRSSYWLHQASSVVERAHVWQSCIDELHHWENAYKAGVLSLCSEVWCIRSHGEGVIFPVWKEQEVWDLQGSLNWRLTIVGLLLGRSSAGSLVVACLELWVTRMQLHMETHTSITWLFFLDGPRNFSYLLPNTFLAQHRGFNPTNSQHYC